MRKFYENEVIPMEKTKLGLSTGIVAAVAFLMFLFGGYTTGLLVLGYVLICEEDRWLKATALKALLLAVAFSVVNFVIGLLPELISILSSLLEIFGGHLYISFISNVANFFGNVVSLLRWVAFAGLAVLALKNKSVPVKFVDNLFAE